MRGLVTRILDCSSAPDRWGDTLDVFNETFQTSSSCMFSIHEAYEFNANFAWSRFFREKLTPETLSLMVEGGDVDDMPGYESLFQNPAQKCYEELALFGTKSRQDLPQSNIRDIVAKFGFYTRSGAALNKMGPWIDAFFCQHKTASEADRFIHDTRTEVVLPIMANSVALGRTLQALRKRFDAALSVLDALGLGVFLVDATGCVVQYNKEAQRIIDTKDGVSVDRYKRLRLNHPDKTKELEYMISAANSILRDGEKAGHSLIASERPSGAYDYLVSARPLSDTNGELEVGLKCAFVTVIDPNRNTTMSADGLTALGKLTVSESDVVALLLQGLRPIEVATHRDVSLNTIKTQLKNISHKLRCSSQSDIIRIAAAANVPIKSERDPPNG